MAIDRRRQHSTSIKVTIVPVTAYRQNGPGHGPTSTFGREGQSNPCVADARYG